MTEQRDSVPDTNQADKDLLYINRVSLSLFGVAMLLVGVHMGWHIEAATALLWALSSLIAGAGVGFLFGIPKVVENDDTKSDAGTNHSPSRYRQKVNTNLTEISDWLTKIIVGVGLTNLVKIPPKINQLAEIMATGFGTTPGDEKSFALAILIGFPVMGFFFGYLYTRLFLAGAFSNADNGRIGQETVEIVKKEAQITAQNTTLLASERLPTEREVDAAEKVAMLTTKTDLVNIRQQLLSFAREYERLRSVMTASDERTRKMEVIVTKMRTLAVAGYDLLAEFSNSKSPGERLVAITMLQVKFTVSYASWLAERLTTERPFVGYHAAVALLTGANAVDLTDCPILKSAIQKAIDAMADMVNTDRYNVLVQAGKALPC